MEPTHLLFIMSDQHARDVTGCYGHPLVQTPNIDRLAARGARFTRAYTPSPVCVPARAALATGQYVHQTGYWDNACPYDGARPGWGRRLKEQGYRVDSIGKLHYRSHADDNGFTREIDPMYVPDGIGDILGCIRHDPPVRRKRKGILEAGPGDSSYLRYDARSADNACRWLAEHARDERPWALFVSFVCPHHPYLAPESLYRLYPLDQIPMPPQWQPEAWPDHPALNHLRRCFDWVEPFDEETIRRLRAAYYGTTTYVDRQIGRVLQALAANGLESRTRIIYTSDHGDSLGARGLFSKLTMYDESAAIPLIVAGPGAPAGRVVETPVSLIDCFSTILEAVGASSGPEEARLPGRSLWAVAREDDQDRTVFSEYHAVGSRNGIYMLRSRQYKYIHYLNDPPQLFDLEADPQELKNLAGLAGYGRIVRQFEQKLRVMVDPEAVDRQAKASQQARIDAFGGEAAVRSRAALAYSPVPGETASFVSRS